MDIPATYCQWKSTHLAGWNISKLREESFSDLFSSEGCLDILLHLSFANVLKRNSCIFEGKNILP